MQTVLVIDDDKDMTLLLSRFLSKNNFDVQLCHTGQAAITWLDKNRPDLVLCDYKLDDMTGVEVLKNITGKYSGLPVIIITGYSDLKDAVEVMKLGAFDYITKPLFPDEIIITIRKALGQEPVTKGSPKSTNKKEAAKPTTKENNTPELIGIGRNKYIVVDSPGITKIKEDIMRVAPTNFSVIIYGESGVGKEAIAQQIHLFSKRAQQPFIAIDCGALSKELAGSELFGHEKGSFTGALNQKIGSFELANGGTVFLDEIANLSYDIQVSLLRVIQERKMRRVGGTKDIHLDVRILIASNEKLWDAAKSGKFREDLYHRFNEFTISVPPLRERKEDILFFAQHFLNLTNTELDKQIKGFSKEVEEIFLSYVWPGNLRELKNVVKRVTLLTDKNVVEASTLPFEISNYRKLQFDDSAEAESKDELPAKKATKKTTGAKTASAK